MKFPFTAIPAADVIRIQRYRYNLSEAVGELLPKSHVSLSTIVIGAEVD
jgi:hypothetical protein